MCKEEMEEKCRCCYQGPVGPQGIQGMQGLQGPVGSQGIQGFQGLPGKDGECKPEDCQHKCECESVYCNVYSLIKQVLSPYSAGSDSVLFSDQNAVTGEFDTSIRNTTGEIIFLKSGVYLIDWIGQAYITPPVPSPVPSFSYALFLDGVLIPGSVNSSFTQSPNDDNSHVSGQVIVQVMKNQKLSMRNSTVLSVTMDPLPSGSVFPISNASINIVMLKALT